MMNVFGFGFASGWLKGRASFIRKPYNKNCKTEKKYGFENHSKTQNAILLHVSLAIRSLIGLPIIISVSLASVCVKASECDKITVTNVHYPLEHILTSG